MAKGISNTSRTLNYIREQGWLADIVERFNAYAGKFGQRKDLFNIIDIIAMGEGSIIGIQSCGQSFSEHDKKILEDPEGRGLMWVEHGGRLILMGWRKVKLKRGGKAMRWAPRIKEYKPEDFI